MFLSKWFRNGRSAALVQSLMPGVTAAVLAGGNDGFRWWAAVLAVAGVGFAHLALNLADDWFDYKVDMKGDRDRVIRRGFRAMTEKYPYLTDGSETLRSTAVAIAAFILAALLCGAAVFIPRTVWSGFTGADGSWWIVAIVAACAFLGGFYSAPPLKLAYHGLGELVTGIIFGPLLMCGVYYASCGSMEAGIASLSIPVGLLVCNILFTHSFIDMDSDKESNKMTFARVLGSRKACLACSFILNLLPFAMVAAAVCAGMLHPAYLAVFIALPRALWLCASLLRFSRSKDGRKDVPDYPPLWLGPMQNDKWEGIRKAGIDWFLMRWFCARNTLSLFCLSIIAVAVILRILS